MYLCNGFIQDTPFAAGTSGRNDVVMNGVDVSGADAAAFLQQITTNDVLALTPGSAHYSLLPNPDGGVIDDIIIYRHHEGPGFMVCINAANRSKDVSWMQAQAAARPGLNVTVTDISGETGMIAIQGPKAEAIVQRLTDVDLSQAGAFSWVKATVAGVPPNRRANASTHRATAGDA
jgi:aminomethyltransferase